MTNKHEQHEKDGHQQWPDYQNQPIFQNFKRTTKPENEEEEQHQHFQHSIQSQEEVRKNQFYQLFEKKSTNQLRRYDDVNTILHSAVHEIPLSTLIWMDQLEAGEAAMKLVKV